MTDSSAGFDSLDEIAEEFLERRRRGERPEVSEYAQRHPEHAEMIREVFPALAQVEALKPSDAERPETLAGEEMASGPVEPRDLGDFRILREVGRGGMGIVYEAVQISLGRHVALKVLPEVARLDARRLERFRREARAAARLHHTNIVPVFGIGDHEGLPYYAMQFIRGVGLDKVLEELRRERDRAGEPAATGGAGLRGTDAPATLSKLAGSLARGEFGPAPDRAVLTDAPDAGTARGGASQDGDAAEAPTTTLPTAVHDPSRVSGRPVEPAPAAIPAPPAEPTPDSSLGGPGRQRWRNVARIGVQVAEALGYAEGQGVVHRDIKPANLLLDLEGTIWVADFGLAKARDDEGNLTHTGDVVGTLRYLAPERLHGRGDIRSDLYSLGLTLYELLTLRPAFDETDRTRLIAAILRDEPPRPRSIDPSIPRDLETIVLKSIARDPAGRYQTAAAKADDLRRFLEDRTITARRASELERVWRWCRRNPAVAGLSLALLLALVAGLAAVSWKWREAAEARERAIAVSLESRRISARLALEKGLDLAEAGEPASGLHWMLEALRATPEADIASLRAVRRNITAWAERVHRRRTVLRHPNPVMAVAISRDGTRLATGTRDATVRIWDAATAVACGGPLRVNSSVHRLAFDAAGRWLAVGLASGRVDIVEVATARRVASLEIGTDGIGGLFFEPDGGAIWACGPDPAGLWQRFDTARGTRLPLPSRLPGPACLPVARPDGAFLVIAPASGPERDGSYRIRNTTTGGVEGAALRPPDGYHPLAFGPLGRVVAFLKNHTEPMGDCLVWLWDGATGRPLGVPIRIRQGIQSWAFSPDERVFASSGIDREARVWDVATGRPIGSSLRHQDSVLNLAFGSDGRTLISGSQDTTACLWDLGELSPSRPLALPVADPSAESARRPGRAPFSRAVFEPHRRSALMRAGTGWALDPVTLPAMPAHGLCRVVDIATGLPRGATLGHRGGYVGAIAFGPDGTLVATCAYPTRGSSVPTSVRLWEAETGQAVGPEMVLPGSVYPWATNALAFSPDGTRLAVAHLASGVDVFEVPAGRRIRRFPAGAGVVCVAFSPDGRMLAAGGGAGGEPRATVHVWDVSTGRPAAPPLLHGSIVWRVLFGPDGRALLTDSETSSRLWEVATSRPLGRPMPSGFGAGGTGGAAFLPDGSALLLGQDTGVARLWSAADGRPVAPPMTDSVPIVSLDVGPRGELAVIAHEDGTVRLWDLATARPLGPARWSPSPILAVAVSDDRRRFLAATADGSVRSWPVPSPVEGDVNRLEPRLIALTGLRMDAGRSVTPLEPEEWPESRREAAGRQLDFLAREPSDWHEQAERDAEAAKLLHASIWHLDHLIASRPDDWVLYVRRARAAALTGRIGQMRADYALAERLAPPETIAAVKEHHFLYFLGAGGSPEVAKVFGVDLPTTPRKAP